MQFNEVLTKIFTCTKPFIACCWSSKNGGHSPTTFAQVTQFNVDGCEKVKTWTGNWSWLRNWSYRSNFRKNRPWWKNVKNYFIVRFYIYSEKFFAVDNLRKLKNIRIFFCALFRFILLYIKIDRICLLRFALTYCTFVRSELVFESKIWRPYSVSYQ